MLPKRAGGTDTPTLYALHTVRSAGSKACCLVALAYKLGKFAVS